MSLLSAGWDESLSISRAATARTSPDDAFLPATTTLPLGLEEAGADEQLQLQGAWGTTGLDILTVGAQDNRETVNRTRRSAKGGARSLTRRQERKLTCATQSGAPFCFHIRMWQAIAPPFGFRWERRSEHGMT